MDGGRIQIRDRKTRSTEEVSKGYWRETLIGCLLSMTSEEQAEDPCPRIPTTFVDPQRMSDCKAFVADGSATNWGVHKKHFSHYTAVLDFTHAICYVYAAAMAGRSVEQGWRDYCQWAQWLWAGQTTELIAAVASRSEAIGPPDKDESETSPRKIVAKTLGYLKNQRSRMKYAEYRKLGLPITSSYIESTIKQINRRVKGTDKFWDQGADPLLQLAADHLSETTDLDRFWKQRRKRLQSMRCYHTTA